MDLLAGLVCFNLDCLGFMVCIYGLCFLVVVVCLLCLFDCFVYVV